MKRTETPSGMEEITQDECLEILEQHSLGRIAIVVDGQPQIFPVNYAVNRRVIAFRTGEGTKIWYAPDSKVCFEIDEYKPSTGVGWSVMVQGVTVDATDSFDDVSWAARSTAPWPLAPGPKPYLVAIAPTKITGRRFQREA